MSATCRGCGAPITWATTVNDKAMPVDAKPVPNGNLVLRTATDPRDPPVVITLDTNGTYRLASNPELPLTPPASERFVSHFSTCPKAVAFRHGKVPR